MGNFRDEDLSKEKNCGEEFSEKRDNPAQQTRGTQCIVANISLHFHLFPLGEAGCLVLEDLMTYFLGKKAEDFLTH